jgi:uncharacterized damage-inducible protein DinB
MNLTHLLVETYVHMPPAQMLSDLTGADATSKPGRAPHSVIEIVAHLHFWQSWFLKRCRGEAEPMVERAKLGWPPAGDWNTVRDQFLAGLQEADALSGGDLTRPISPAIDFPPMAQYTLGDVLTHIAVHNAHHLGQVVLIRQMLGVWPPPSGSWTW